MVGDRHHAGKRDDDDPPPTVLPVVSPSDIRDYADLLDKMESVIIPIYAEKRGNHRRYCRAARQ